MSSGYTPLAMPGSLDTETPPKEWSEPVLEAQPPANVPVPFSEAKEHGGKAKTLGEASREPHQAPEELEKQETQSGDDSESQPIGTGVPPSVGATSVVQTAKQYMPEQVGRAVDYAAQTAAAAAAAYLPDPQGVKDTVSSYLSSGEPERGEQHHVSLPSMELKGAQPSEHVGGVGALPGNLSESSVALLPEEREEKIEERRPVTPRQRRDTIKPSAAGGEEPQEEKEAEATKPGDTAASQDDPIASQQPDSPPKSTHAGDVGTVEGDTAASSGPEIEKLPKEASRTKSEQAQTPSEQETADVIPVAGMVGTAPEAEKLGEREEEVQESESDPASGNPPEDKGPLSGPQEAPEGGGKEGGAEPEKMVKPGYGGDYHPAQLHPPPPGASVAEYKASQSAKQEEEEVKDMPVTETGKRASVGTEKKHGFMTMIKGEVKILAGKMSRDEHKVEEGKKIVHGQM